MFDWSLAEGAPGGIKLILAGGLTHDNVAEAIARIRPWGVDVSSGVESTPGRKDARKLRLFVEQARAAGERLEDKDNYEVSEEVDLTAVEHDVGRSRPFDWMLDA